MAERLLHTMRESEDEVVVGCGLGETGTVWPR